MEEKEDEKVELENFSNYQFPIRKFERETFKVILIKKNFLILSDKDGNYTRIFNSFSNLYSIGEKIYKENGIFLWKREQLAKG